MRNPRSDVQARSARTRTFTRAFDQGHPVVVSGRPSGASGDEYEVPESGWPCETCAGTVEYEVPGAACEPVVDVPRSPEPPASVPPVPESEGPASSDPRTELSHDTVLADIQSIVSRSARPSPSRPSSPSPEPAAPRGVPRNEHAIFDRIAASMSQAHTYDLGDLALQQCFDAFDQEQDARPRTGSVRKSEQRPASPQVKAGPVGEFLEDLERIHTARDAVIVPEVASARAVEGEPDAGGRAATSAAQDIPLDPGSGGRSISAEMLEPGDILLSTTDAGVSRAIRAVTHAPISHAALYVGGGRVVEAIDDGVTLRSLDIALADDTLAVAYRHRDMTPEKAAQVVDFAESQARAGRPFDRWGLVRVAPGHLARAVCNRLDGEARRRCLAAAGRLRVGTDDSGSFYCSELVLTAFRHAGLGLADQDPSWSAPGQILDLHHNGLLDYVGHLKV